MDAKKRPGTRPGRGAAGVLLSWAIITWQTVALVVSMASSKPDALGYWLTPLGDPYALPWGAFGAFPYSPVAVLALWPIQQLPELVWLASWTVLNVVLVIWLVRSPIIAAVLLIGPAMADSWNPLLSVLWWGNVAIPMVAATVALVRHPAAGAFLVLTKVTPGVAVLWFAFRREWRSLGIAGATTLGLALVSVALAPDLWRQWVGLLVSQPTPALAEIPPLPLGPAGVRTVIAAGIVALAAWTDRRWPLAFAVWLAQPAIWPASIVMIALALPRLGLGSEERGRSPRLRVW